MKRLVRLATIMVTLLIVYVLVVWIWTDNVNSVNFENLRTAWTETNSTNNIRSIEMALQEMAENNEEAKEFVDNFPNRAEYLNLEIDLTEDVQEGQVPLFLQWDMRWGYEEYGDNIIALAGCGPTCMSMAYVYLTGDLEGNPREVARYAQENGFHSKGGTDWSLWTYGAKELGITGEELPLDERQIKVTIDNGGVVVCSMRPGDFTRTGHYILIKDYDENGFYINDPNSVKNSEKQWFYEDIKGQIKNLWSLSF